MDLDAVFVLIVEDDPQVRSLLGRLMARQGYDWSTAASCSEAKDAIKKHKPNLVLLDRGLPGGDGLDLGKWVRSTSPTTAIIILTARSDVASRIAGLDSCADDYVAKPFDPEELVARVDAVLRRTLADKSPGSQAPKTVHFEGWQLDEDECALVRSDVSIRLTVTEFRLLKALTEKPGKVATRAWLLDCLKTDVDVGERTVDYHVCTLRTKLSKEGLNGRAIASVRGIGYKYVATSVN
jgi:DNA-binding response OmpR family regulator